MQIILAIIASSILISAQALWKKAFSSVVFAFSKEFLISNQFLKIIFSPYFLLGAFLYVTATIFYIYLFNRYSFYSVQSIMLVASITLSFLIASFIFKEPITLFKIGGLMLLISGIVLIYKK